MLHQLYDKEAHGGAIKGGGRERRDDRAEMRVFLAQKEDREEDARARCAKRKEAPKPEPRHVEPPSIDREQHRADCEGELAGAVDLARTDTVNELTVERNECIGRQQRC